MRYGDKLKMACTDKEITLTQLAEKYGMSQNSFMVKLSRNTLRFTEAEKIADCLDCDVVLMDRKTKKVY